MHRRIKQLLEEGETLALATIVSKFGSTPRDLAAKMAATSSGETLGTVGGGCGEAEVLRKAIQVIRSRKPAMVKVELMDDIESDSPAVCGGVMNVFIDPWWDDEKSVCNKIADELIRAESDGAAAVMATILQTENLKDSAPGDKCLVRENAVRAGNIRNKQLLEAVLKEAEIRLNREESKQQTLVFEDDGKAEVFFEAIPAIRKAVIVGAGHLAIPLVQYAKTLGFHVTVLDDRVLYANRNRFPEADDVRAGNMAETLRGLEITPHTYIVLITRGHQFDEPCLREVIHSKAKYIGMIGSKRRIKACFIRFRDEEGIPEELLKRVHAPIGLDIGAESPEEIALSIVSEMVKVRRGGTAQSLSLNR